MQSQKKKFHPKLSVQVKLDSKQSLSTFILIYFWFVLQVYRFSNTVLQVYRFSNTFAFNIRLLLMILE